jgi:hypothetical protein
MANQLKQLTVSVRPYSPGGAAALDEVDAEPGTTADRVKTTLVIAAAMASVLVGFVAARALF